MSVLTWFCLPLTVLYPEVWASLYLRFGDVGFALIYKFWCAILKGVFVRPEVTLCSWQDVKTQERTLLSLELGRIQLCVFQCPRVDCYQEFCLIVVFRFIHLHFLLNPLSARSDMSQNSEWDFYMWFYELCFVSIRVIAVNQTFVCDFMYLFRFDVNCSGLVVKYRESIDHCGWMDFFSWCDRLGWLGNLSQTQSVRHKMTCGMNSRPDL